MTARRVSPETTTPEPVRRKAINNAADVADLAGVLLDLAFVAEHWESLSESREPGTARPWRQSMLDPERRAVVAERDRLERAVRDPDAPGFTAAAMHVDVLDAMVEIWVTVDELAQKISRFVVATNLPRLQVRRLADLPDTLRFVETWLPTAALVRPSIATKPGITLHRLTVEIQRLLSLVRGGQILTGASCPWCRGVTPKHPAGGAPTMRVEEITRARAATKDRPAVEPTHAVVCWNAACDPPDDDVGIRYFGRPAWPLHEWEWLADRLIVPDEWEQLADRIIVPEAPETDTSAGAVPVVHSGRSGVDASLCVLPTSSDVLKGVRFIDQPEG
jgi:hypothetical protein